MKVTEIRTFTTWGEPRNWVFVKILTDDGLHGWGEATLEGKRGDRRAPASSELGAGLIGQDPLADRAPLAAALPPRLLARRRRRSTRRSPAIDQALWDIARQGLGRAGLPAARRADARPRSASTPTSASTTPTCWRRTPAATSPTASPPSRPAPGPATRRCPRRRRSPRFAERVGRLRAIVGPTSTSMIDNHGRSRPSTAVRLMEALAAPRPALAGGADPAGRHRGARARARGRPDDGPRDRRAPLLEVGLRAAAGAAAGRRDPARPLPRRRHHRVQEDRRAGRGVLRPGRAAHPAGAGLDRRLRPTSALAIPNFLILEFVRSAPLPRPGR